MQTTLDLAQSGHEKKRKSPKEKARWKLPEEGHIKVNTDASFFESTSSGGTGLVIHDHQGDLIRVQAQWYDHAAKALTMESVAIRDGVKVAVDRGYDKERIANRHSRLYGAENTIEKRALRQAEICRRNSLPEGEIDAIVTVIELDIIGIIITIISIIITAISTAAPRHRCNI
ncbi:hypothetical protein QYE76_008636 [Lolium multiflorum]|uniref:RNase H type-1 domain-containing protein n=1 Tax=Lolium multiflorum TaxID=4521 RepID=A0AAD8X2U2_LOLMU|nr:hypothetical protein QYE76_008636 [Lolium multiflorum]